MDWSIEKMRKFFNEIKDYDYIWYMLIYVLANTGVRRSELFGLRQQDEIFLPLQFRHWCSVSLKA